MRGRGYRVSPKFSGVPAGFAAKNLAEYLAFGYVPTPRTLFEGIHKLPPASLLTVDANGVQGPRAYWSLRVPPVGEEDAYQAGPTLEDRGHLLHHGTFAPLLVVDVGYAVADVEVESRGHRPEL